MNRVVTIQDISCVGKCSLTVALPIISALGVETAIIPTAVLSNHTAFSSFTFHDLTEEIKPIGEQLEKHGLVFDGLYTGYLGSIEQVEIVSEFIAKFKRPDNFVFVDPAMGDFGKLYSGFDDRFAKEMVKLCTNADIIVPNLTEASFMLDVPYIAEDYSREYVQDILKRFVDMGVKQAVLTGVSFSPNEIGVMSYDGENFFEYYNPRVNATFHGTGDIFASTTVGAMVQGATLEQALKLAADFTLESIKLTIADPQHNWYGVNFEQALGMLTGMKF